MNTDKVSCSNVVGTVQGEYSMSLSRDFPSAKYALMLTSSDTDQVASSQWVSMEPSNRKQVKLDTPVWLLNIAVKTHRALFWPCQATSAHAPV